jgi:hypothetical protein
VQKRPEQLGVVQQPQHSACDGSNRACHAADDTAVTRRRLPLQSSLMHHVTSGCTTRARLDVATCASLHVRTFDCGGGVCCHAWLTHHLHSGRYTQ